MHAYLTPECDDHFGLEMVTDTGPNATVTRSVADGTFTRGEGGGGDTR